MYRVGKRFKILITGNCMYAVSHDLSHRTGVAPRRNVSGQIRQLDALLAQNPQLRCHTLPHLLFASPAAV